MKNDLILGILFFLLSLFLYFYLIPNQIVSLGFTSVALGPRFFPQVSAFLLGFFSLFLIGSTLYSYYKEGRFQKDTFVLFSFEDLRILGIFIMLILFVMLFTRFHFILSSFITCMGLLYFFGQKNHLLNGTLSISLSIGIYYFFMYVLGIVLRV